MPRISKAGLGRRILVALRDPAKTPKAQLRKAARIARLTGASIELFHAIGATPAPGPDPVAVHANRALKRLERQRCFSGLKVKSHMVWDYPAHEAVVRRVLETRSDFVIAASATHGLGQRLLLTNNDWELIRHCPVPLLLVKSTRDYVRPNVIAALDPFHVHAKPAALDHRLLESGAAMASLLNGRLHAFHAYLPLVFSVIVPVDQGPLWLPREAEDAYAQAVTRAFHRLARSANIPEKRRHLATGDVAERLAATVRRIHADIVVMGAISRSGLKRLFIGSTAERVLDLLRCDVLVIKPRGFKARVPRRRSPYTGPTLY
jgi:universal stress protein E